MEFSSGADGIQWIAHDDDDDDDVNLDDEGVAISMDDQVLAGFEGKFSIVDEYHLIIWEPDEYDVRTYECRNLLAPQVSATARLILESAKTNFLKKVLIVYFIFAAALLLLIRKSFLKSLVSLLRKFP